MLPNSESTPVEMFPGIVRRALCGGERMTLCEITLHKGVGRAGAQPCA